MPKKGPRRKRPRPPDRHARDNAAPPDSVRWRPGDGGQPRHSWAFHAAAVMVVCALGAVLYSNALNGPFVFDDTGNVYGNPFIVKVRGLDWQSLYDVAAKSPNARPVANISFALNYCFGGFDVTGYHVVNTVIHLLAGIVVYFLASVTFRLFFDIQRGEAPSVGDRAIGWMSLFAACIFVAHPLQTQAVTYIVQRMTSMGGMFSLLSLLLYIHGRRLRGRKRWALWSGCLIAWLLALGSKQTAAVLPLLVVLYEWYFFQDLSAAWLRRSARYGLVLAVVLVLVVLVCLGGRPVERILARYEHRDFTLGERVLTQFRVLVRYVGLVVLPLPSRLNLLHPVSTSRSLLQPITTLFSLLAVAGLAGLAVGLARRQRLLSFCVLWFFLNLAIESSVIALEMIYEHRLYLPMVAFALAAPYGVHRLLAKRASVAAGLGVVAILCLGTGTYVRNRVWQDDVALWTDVVAKNPQEHRAHYNLGNALRKKGRTAEAVDHYRLALGIKRDYPDAHNNLGNALKAQGRIAEAIGHYRQALEIDPGYAGAHIGLGNAFQRQGKIAQAVEHYHRALRVEPDHAVAHNSLAWLLATSPDANYRDGGRAAEHAQRACVLTGWTNAGCLDTLAAACAESGEFAEAVRWQRKAAALVPDRLRPGLLRRLKLYQAGQPYREPPKHGATPD